MPWIAAYFTTWSFWFCVSERVWYGLLGRFSFSLEKVVITSLLACTIADAGTYLERGPDGSRRNAMAALSIISGIGLKYRRF